MITKRDKELLTSWLIINLQNTSKSNVEIIVAHIDRYFQSPSPIAGGELYRWTDELVERFAEQYRFSSSRISIDMFKRDNPQTGESEQDELWKETIPFFLQSCADYEGSNITENIIKELSSKYLLIKK